MHRAWIQVPAVILVSAIAVMWLNSFEPFPVVRLPLPANLSAIERVTVLSAEAIAEHALIRGGESIISHQDSLVTGTLDGKLVGFDAETLSIKWSVQCPLSTSGTPCRILGLRSVGDSIYGVDQHGRLFRFRDKTFEWLLHEETPELKELEPPGFFNDLVVVEDVIYLTDSFSDNTKAGVHAALQKFWRFDATGRIFAYNLTSRKLDIFADKLYLPNGIELAYDNKSLLVSECSRFRVVRIDLTTQNLTIFTTSTLGAVDNIRRSSDGGYWFGVSKSRLSRSGMVDLLSYYSTARYILTQKLFMPLLFLHERLFGSGPVFYKTDQHGNITRAYVDPDRLTGSVALSQICEVGGYIFVGTPFAEKVFRFKYDNGL